MIILRNITKYRKTQKDIRIYSNGQPILDNLSLSFPDKGLIFLTGDEEAGKCVLNIICGLDKPDTGEIEIDEKKASQFNDDNWSSLRSSYFGLSFSNIVFQDELSLKDNLTFPLKKEEIYKSNLLTNFDLESKYKISAKNLSSDQIQELCLARALSKNPKVLLIEDIFKSNYKDFINHIFAALKQESKERLVIVTSKDIAFLSQEQKKSIKNITIIGGKSNKIGEEVKTNSNKETAKNNTSIWLCLKAEFANSLVSGFFKWIFIYLFLFISFGLFSTGLSFRFISNRSSLIKESLGNSNDKSILVSKKIDNDFGNRFFGHLKEDELTYLSRFDNRISGAVSAKFSPVISEAVLENKNRINESDPLYLYKSYFHSIYFFEPFNRINEYGTGKYSLTELSFIDNLNYFPKEYKLLSGSLPLEADQILLTDYQYNLFKTLGFYDYLTKEEIESEEITSPDVILGKHIPYTDVSNNLNPIINYPLTICGILDTEYNPEDTDKLINFFANNKTYPNGKDMIDRLKDSPIEIKDIYEERRNYIFNSYVNLGLVSKNIVEKNISSKMDYSFSISPNDDSNKLIDFLSTQNINDNNAFNLMNESAKDYKVFINNNLNLSTKIIVLGVVFIIISSTIYILISQLVSKKKENHILSLKALGVSKKQFIHLNILKGIIVFLISISLISLTAYLESLIFNFEVIKGTIFQGSFIAPNLISISITFALFLITSIIKETVKSIKLSSKIFEFNQTYLN